jgi:hypothetical protein
MSERLSLRVRKVVEVSDSNMRPRFSLQPD